MKKFLLFSALVSGSLFLAQKGKVYESPNYTVNVPEGWKSTNDSEIVNIFPSNEIGAITISEYHDLNLPKAETKKFILALYKSEDAENKVKENKSKKDLRNIITNILIRKKNYSGLPEPFRKIRSCIW